MVCTGKDDHDGDGNRCGNHPVSDKKDRDCRKKTDDISCNRVQVRSAGKQFQILRLPKRKDSRKLQEGYKGSHTHSLYNREVQPAINPATASSRKGPSVERIPGFFWSYRVNSNRAYVPPIHSAIAIPMISSLSKKTGSSAISESLRLIYNSSSRRTHAEAAFRGFSKVGRDLPGKQKGANLMMANPLIFLVELVGIEPTTS